MHKAIEILIEQEPSFKPNPKFKTKNADWEKWEQFLQARLEEYSTNFPLEILENSDVFRVFLGRPVHRSNP